MPLVQDYLQPYVRITTSNRLALYGVLSSIAVSAVILNAFKNYSNFYSVAVYLSRSNRSVMVLANFALLCAILFSRGLQHIFFGPLRANEVERLYDRIWFFLTESLLAFTIFRDEFDVSFGVMFGLLLFVKCFHWLTSFRVEWMDQIQYPGPDMWFHIRMNILFIFLWFTDAVMLCFAIESILTHGMGGVVLFASEYAILMASVLNSISKYFIICYDIRRAGARGGENAPVWEDKSMIIFYVELVTDFLKLITYLTFFLLVMTFYGLPLNIVRDVYLTARSFINRCRDLIRYRTATRNMDERYPNATEEELAQMNDRTCIICREEMVFRNPAAAPGTARAPAGVNDTPKKLPCGHFFHFHCLRSWLERQQSCPTCRRTVLEHRPPPQHAGAQGQPRGPPAPQPGAIPQMPGFGAPQQPQQPGFFARMLGNIAGAPPVVPGQFAPGPPFFNQQQGAFNNQVPQQGFPAQNPFVPWQPPPYHVPAQQGAAPVQVLQGFYIGNQWQPWGAPPQVPQTRPQQVRGQGLAPGQPFGGQAQTPTAGQSQQSQLPLTGQAVPQAQAANAQPTTGVSTQAPSDSGSAAPRSIQPPSVGESSSQGEGSGLGKVNDPATSNGSAPSTAGPTPSHINAREAAGLAAVLRRLNSRGVVPASSISPTATSSDATSRASQNIQNPAPSTSTTRDSLGTANPPTSRGPSPNFPSAQTTTAPSPRPTPTTPGSRPAWQPVPSLIPLFDPATTSATIVPPPPFFRGPFAPTPSYQPYPNAQPTFAQQRLRPRPGATDANTYFNESVRNPGLPDLRALPQTLTEEQLNRLDEVTREAIEERLRTLENVQGAIWRSVEELIRVRSSLPVRQPPHEPPAQHRENVPGRAEDSNAKGKEKAAGSQDAAGQGSTDPPVIPTTTISGAQMEPPGENPALDQDTGVADPTQ